MVGGWWRYGRSSERFRREARDDKVKSDTMSYELAFVTVFLTDRPLLLYVYCCYVLYTVVIIGASLILWREVFASTQRRVQN